MEQIKLPGFERTQPQTHYGKYVLERENKHILETDYGFATYKFENDYVYLDDIYVEKTHRRHGKSYELADIVANIAKSKGYSKMLGSVCPQANNATASLHVLLNYGFQLAESHPNMIYFIKEI